LEEAWPDAMEVAKKTYEKRETQEAGKINSTSYKFCAFILLFYFNKRAL